MDCAIPDLQLAEALDDCARDALELAGVHQPPIDARIVAARHGLIVATDKTMSARARFVRLQHRRPGATCGAIVVGPEPRAERIQWAIAHEIGEHLAHRVFEFLQHDVAEAPPQSREKVANLLASRLLLPGECFKRRGEAGDWDLIALKRDFMTASHELIARRILDFEPARIVSVFDQGKLTWRAASMNRPVVPLIEEERQVQRRVHQQNEATSASREEVRVRGWPIHEPGWKREILLLEPTEVP